MAKTYEPIAKATLGSEAATIEFTSIPAIYTDLILVLNGKTSTAGTGTSQIRARINSDTGSNYSSTDVGGDGSSVGSGRDTNQTFILNIAWPNSGSTTISPGIAILQFQSYSNTNVNKTVLTSIEAAGQIIRAVSLWRSTAAISAVTLYFDSTNKHAAGTVATLYGIKAKSPVVPLLTESTKTTSSVSAIIGNYDAGLTYTLATTAGTATRSGDTVTVSGLTEGQNITLTVTATNGANSSSSNTISLTSSLPPTGGSIVTSGGYRYHTFTSSSTFTLYDTRSVEYLIIGGGGGGGNSRLELIGAGGGAGGVASSSATLTAGNYSVAIGAGNSGGVASQASGSSFGAYSVLGGGYGDGQGNSPFGLGGGPGGSGGGGNSAPLGSTNAGSGSPGQGFPGGNGNNSRAGGGGGASEAGKAGFINNSSLPGGGTIDGRGGAGTSSYSAWAAATGTGVSDAYAGGGAGGWVSSSAAGGGGTGGNQSPGSGGTVNTGSGGGGAASTSTSTRGGGSGGSGIVIIRYAI